MYKSKFIAYPILSITYHLTVCIVFNPLHTLHKKKTPPDLLLRKSGGVDALLVLFQALTQSLAGGSDRSLGSGAKIAERFSLHSFYASTLNLIAFFQIRHGSEDLQRM